MSFTDKIITFQDEIAKEFRKLEHKLLYKQAQSTLGRGLHFIDGGMAGQNLVLNGNGATGDNTNFFEFNVEEKDTNGAKRAFSVNRRNADVEIEEYIPIEPGGEYLLKYDIKAKRKVGNPLYYVYVSTYDVERNFIGYHNIPQVVFELGNDWTPSQNFFIVSERTKKVFEDYWTPRARHNSNYIVCEDSYTNRYGFKYPSGSYTRKSFTSNHTYASTSYDSRTGRMSNLKTHANAFNGRILPAGTKLSICTYSGTYSYFSGYANVITPDEWSTVRIKFKVENTVRKGGACIRLGWLLNRSSLEGSETLIANVGLYQTN